jgi:hypothetical protein
MSLELELLLKRPQEQEKLMTLMRIQQEKEPRFQLRILLNLQSWMIKLPHLRRRRSLMKLIITVMNFTSHR